MAETQSLDRDAFRQVIGHFTSGVTVITAAHDGTRFGLTASAVASLSLDPPMLIACINRQAGTCHAVSASRAFTVNILREDQGDIARQFATPSGDKFRGIEVGEGTLGQPLLSDALANVECQVVEEVVGGTHSVFLGEAVRAHAADGAPLAYYRGGFGRFESANDEQVYQELRERVLNRRIGAGEAVGAQELADELLADPAAVYHALTRLSTEGLLQWTPDRGYVVRPVTAEALEDALEARGAIELAAVELAVGRVPDDRLVELRRRMQATEPLVSEGRFVDLDRYIETNTAFHECLVGLADNRALLALYRRLFAEAIMMRSLHGTEVEVSDALIDDHRELVEAFEAGDADRARGVILRHTVRARDIGRRGVERAGGQL